MDENSVAVHVATAFFVACSDFKMEADGSATITNAGNSLASNAASYPFSGEVLVAVGICITGPNRTYALSVTIDIPGRESKVCASVSFDFESGFFADSFRLEIHFVSSEPHVLGLWMDGHQIGHLPLVASVVRAH